jgi:hypothetical protein
MKLSESKLRSIIREEIKDMEDLDFDEDKFQNASKEIKNLVKYIKDKGIDIANVHYKKLEVTQYGEILKLRYGGFNNEVSLDFNKSHRARFDPNFIEKVKDAIINAGYRVRDRGSQTSTVRV